MNSMIKIGEQEYKLKYTVRALFIYERLAGKSYDLGELINDYLLLYSILLAVNETFDMKFDDFIDQCDLNPSIFNEFKKWFLTILEQKATLQNQEKEEDTDKKKD